MLCRRCVIQAILHHSPLPLSVCGATMVEENTAECVVEPEEAYYGGDADEGADDDDDEDDDDDDDVDTDDDADFFRHTTILICT